MGIRVCLVLIKPQMDHYSGQDANLVEIRNWCEAGGRERVWMGRDAPNAPRHVSILSYPILGWPTFGSFSDPNVYSPGSI